MKINFSGFQPLKSEKELISSTETFKASKTKKVTTNDVIVASSALILGAVAGWGVTRLMGDQSQSKK